MVMVAFEMVMVAFEMVMVLFEFFHRWSSVLAAKRGSFFLRWSQCCVCLCVSKEPDQANILVMPATTLRSLRTKFWSSAKVRSPNGEWTSAESIAVLGCPCCHTNSSVLEHFLCFPVAGGVVNACGANGNHFEIHTVAIGRSFKTVLRWEAECGFNETARKLLHATAMENKTKLAGKETRETPPPFLMAPTESTAATLPAQSLVQSPAQSPAQSPSSAAPWGVEPSMSSKSPQTSSPKVQKRRNPLTRTPSPPPTRTPTRTPTPPRAASVGLGEDDVLGPIKRLLRKHEGRRYPVYLTAEQLQQDGPWCVVSSDEEEEENAD